MIAHSNRFFAAVSLSMWGFSIEPADYWGWKHVAHVGPLIVFFGQSAALSEHKEPKE